MRTAVALWLALGTVLAQPDWRRVGGPSVELGLASPVTGPVDRVWFSAGGARLLARTQAGRTLESADFETWTAAANPENPPEALDAVAARLPERDVKVLADPQDARRLFALGRHLYRSADGGRSWTNLTAFGSESVIGSAQRDVAVSPRDPDVLVVANDFGIWRSNDGGMSWNGLNQALPNLRVRRILATPRGLDGARVVVDGIGPVEQLPGAGPEWRPASDARLEQEVEARRTASRLTGDAISALGGEGEIRYAGAADGRLGVSLDRGRTWRLDPSPAAGGPVEGIYVDEQEPRLAVAVASGKGPRVLRSTNTGVTWEDWTANLPDTPVHAIAVDRAGRGLYVATDRGVFLHRGDLDGAAPQWTPVAGLPAAAASDVRLDPAGNQLYVALDGYGVFAAAAPHRAGWLRVVNAADFSLRPAAPGSLMSVLGGPVSRARARDLSFPVLDASENESQIQVPFEATGSSLPLVLESEGRTVNLGVPLQSVSPAVFIDREGAPMLLDGDSGVRLDARNRARSGSRVQILATGLGRVRPDWPTGLAAPLEKAPEVRAAVTALLDRIPVPVARATLFPGYVGFYLIEIQLPAILNAGPAELYIAADGQESNRVRLYLER
ncbi:MAG: hypothetical protein HYR60_05865 [Acidobacteria bacterium]|nr:hypothetical protein [Acidobacteriota bacterium]